MSSVGPSVFAARKSHFLLRRNPHCAADAARSRLESLIDVSAPGALRCALGGALKIVSSAIAEVVKIKDQTA